MRTPYRLIERIVFIASTAASMAADAIAFVVTWRRTYRVVRLSREANFEASFSSLLLRDGQFMPLLYPCNIWS